MDEKVGFTMSKSVDRKSEALGMSYGKASNILRKSLMFELMTISNRNNCYRCKERIETVDEMSIDHKIDWLNSEDPVRFYFDLDNIAFSHYSCNISVSKTNTRASTGYKGVTYTPETYAGKPYRVQVYKNRKSVYSAFFENLEEAVLHYDKKAKEILGEKAVTNSELGLI